MRTALYKLSLGENSITVRFVRHRKARRYVLRLQADGVARVTIPRGGSMEYALEFARKNTLWIEKQLRKAPAQWTNGTTILFRGVPTTIRVGPMHAGFEVQFAEWRFQITSLEDLRPKIEAHLRSLATAELTVRTQQLARELNLEIGAVTVRSQKSRWGSCSSRKTISLNWRLIQTPDFVRDYIIIHELMHLKEMNHSPRFWAHVKEAFPSYPEAESWLRKNGSFLAAQKPAPGFSPLGPSDDHV